jgi:hypothetical protein
VAVHEGRADGGELAHQRVAGAHPHLREEREDDAVGLAHPLDEDPVVVRAGRRGDLGHPRLLGRVGRGRQQDAELVGHLAGLHVEVGVFDAEVLADLADGG